MALTDQTGAPYYLNGIGHIGDTGASGTLIGLIYDIDHQTNPVPVDCAVTTAAPTYTTATNAQLSCTLAGLLRVDASGTPLTVLATADNTTGAVTLGALNAAATLPVVNGQSSAQLHITGSGTLGVTVQYSKDNFATFKNASYIGTTGIINSGTTPITVAGDYRFVGVTDFPYVRAIATSYTSGNFVVNLTTGTGVDGAAFNAIPGAFQDTNTPIGIAVSPAAIAPAQASCGTTATLIVAARTGAIGTGRVNAFVENGGTVAVYVGGSGVTPTTGLLLPGTVGASLSIPTTAALYCVVASGTEPVSAMETY